MSDRAVRVGLVVLLIVTLCGAGYELFLTEQRIGNERSAERDFDEMAWVATVSIADLRAAQQAYVAAGQDATYWTAKTSSHWETLTTNLARLRQLSMAPPAQSSLTTAADLLDHLRRIDARAHDYAAGGQRLLASDLLFTDAMELTTDVSSRIELARTRERAVRDQTVVRQRRNQALVLAAAVGMGVLVALLLLPAVTTKQDVAVANTSPTPASRTSVTGRDRLTLANFDLSGRATAQLDGVPAAEARDAVADQADGKAAAGLRAAAALCVEFGKVCDTQGLVALLERAAPLLNASGIIIWIGDPSGRELRPALGYGYPPQALARMGSIQRDADNATAAAYRVAEMQTVQSEGGAPGAIVAPLIATASCVGVMTAEVRSGSESREPIQALATIVAAQLAGFVAVAPPAEAAQAHG